MEFPHYLSIIFTKAQRGYYNFLGFFVFSGFLFQTLPARILSFVLMTERGKEYYEDENVYEQIDKWIEDFISQLPPEKRDEIRRLIKENTESIWYTGYRNHGIYAGCDSLF